jgi:hypothetical protein
LFGISCKKKLLWQERIRSWLQKPISRFSKLICLKLNEDQTDKTDSHFHFWLQSQISGLACHLMTHVANAKLNTASLCNLDATAAFENM